MKQNFFPKTIIQALGLIFISILIASPFFFLQKQINISQQLFLNVFFILFSSIIILISFLINRKRGIKHEINIRINNIRLIPLMVLVIYFFQVGVSKPIFHLIGLFNEEVTPLNNPIDASIHWMGLILLAPILEEIIFRGIVLKGFLINYNPKKAILLSAIVFGIVHMEPTQVINAFIIGLFFGWIYYKTKSILITMILHFIANSSVFIQSILYYKYADPNTVTKISIYIIPISLILISVMLNRLIKNIKPKLVENQQNTD
jgi:membrane protease YdiL (CAAX protease family)|tara:strand:+ start:51 stop:833 length:783 start_codon:yes stop_codon:yes gene_type:complete